MYTILWILYYRGNDTVHTMLLRRNSQPSPFPVSIQCRHPAVPVCMPPNHLSIVATLQSLLYSLPPPPPSPSLTPITSHHRHRHDRTLAPHLPNNASTHTPLPLPSPAPPPSRPHLRRNNLSTPDSTIRPILLRPRLRRLRRSHLRSHRKSRRLLHGSHSSIRSQLCHICTTLSSPTFNPSSGRSNFSIA